MADMDKYLVLQITSNTNEATQAIDSLIKSLKGLDSSLKLGNLSKFSTSLKDISDAVKSLDQQGGMGKSINSIVDATSKLKDLKIGKNNAIAKIVPDLKELQGITIPNFSNLDVLTDVLIKLQTVSPKKISAIATAIKDFGGNFTVNINGLDKAATAAGQVASSASGIKETTTAINELAQAEQNASANVSQMTDTSGVQQAKKNMESLATDIQKCGEAAKNVTGDLQNVGKAVDPEKIKESGEAFSASADVMESAASSTSTLTEKYSTLLEKIKEYSHSISLMKKNPQTFEYDKFVELSDALARAKNEFKELENSISKPLKTFNTDKLSQELKQISDRMDEIKQRMSNMDSGVEMFDVREYKALGAELDKLSGKYNTLLGNTKSQKSGNIDLLASLVALSHELQTVASTFDHWGDSGIKLLKAVFSPLGLAFKDFQAKIKGISDAMKNLRANMQKHLTKMSAFWKRAMKTFTFMLVRKAITAILSETKNAIDSLAMWSNQFGTAFNGSMSEIVANASYLARNLIAMFEPIIN